MRRSVRACANAALVVTSVIVGILFCELGLRMVGYTDPVRAPRTGLAPRFYYKADPVNGHDIAKNFAGGFFEFPDYIRIYGVPFTVSSNSLGCRDRSFDQEDGYVLLLGDSFTWGYVALEQTWGATLEQLIGIRVLKCGVGGYGPRQERHKLKAVVGQAGRPRLVVVGYTVGNDLLDDYLYPGRTVIDGYMVTKVALADAKRGDRKVYSEDELQARLRSILEQKPAGFTAGVKDVLAYHSVLYDLLRNSEALRRMTARLGLAEPPPTPSDLEALRSIAEYPWLDQAWKEHLANLRQFKSEVEAVGATMLVVIFPTNTQVYESLRPQEGNLQWEYPNQRLTEFFQQEHITFLDLMPEFRHYARCNGSPMSDTQEDLYWPHDGHPNVKGNRLAGLLISRQVLEQPFLELHDKSRRLSDINQLLSASDRCRFSRAPQ
jgi:hypothetical protein